MQIENLKVKKTFITKEVGDRIFTFAVVRTALKNGKDTTVSIGVSSRSPEDQDNLRKDKNGKVILGKDGEPLKLPEDLGEQIALGKALKNPLFAFRMAYGPNEKQTAIWRMVNGFVDAFVADPDSFVIGIRYNTNKSLRNVTNAPAEKLEPISLGELDQVVLAGKAMLAKKETAGNATVGPVQ